MIFLLLHPSFNFISNVLKVLLFSSTTNNEHGTPVDGKKTHDL